jgi:hypothetical protein
MSMDLLGIDWKNRHYTVSSQEFEQLDAQEKKEAEETLEEEKAALRTEEQRIGIRNVAI